MSIAHLLESFDLTRPTTDTRLSEDALESLKLDSFESGYKAGWDDALKSREGDDQKISDEFTRNLADMSFTYHEARSQLLQVVAPLLSDIVEKILPEVVHATIGQQVADQLFDMARTGAEQSVEIVTSTVDLNMVETMLNQDFGFPVRAVSDDTLASGQVYLRMAQDERQIDMAAVLDGVRDAVAGLLDDTQRTLKHG